jgi:hypothetical protein
MAKYGNFENEPNTEVLYFKENYKINIHEFIVI